jgi:hypothetical protein
LFHRRNIEGVKRTVPSGLVLGFSCSVALLFALIILLFGLSAVACPPELCQGLRYDDIKFGTSVSTEVRPPVVGEQPNIRHPVLTMYNAPFQNFGV